MKRSRRMILDATVAVIEQAGYSGLNVAAIATEAGVTRPTIYSNFGTLPFLVSAAVSERAAEVLGQLAADIDHIDDAAEFAVEFIVAARAAIRGDRVLTEVLYAQTDSRILDADVVDRGLMVSGPMLDVIIARAPWLDGDDRAEVAELIVRISLSAIIFASKATDSDDGLRRMLHRWIDPILASPTAR